MPMKSDEIEALIRAALPDATVELSDFAGHGDDDHVKARVTSKAFEGKTRVEQHKMVYAALRGAVGERLHALQIETAAPAEGS